jgi:hypothetical protein
MLPLPILIFAKVAGIVSKADSLLPATQEAIAQIAALIPEWNFFRYNDLFSR